MNDLINLGNFSFSYFTGGSKNMEGCIPINIMIMNINGILTQMVPILDSMEIRTKEDGQFTTWRTVKSSTFIYQQDIAPENVEKNTLWIDTSNPLYCIMKIYDGGNWIDVRPDDIMDASVYDKNNRATDIFEYIDTKVAEGDMDNVSQKLDAHIVDSNIHVTKEEQQLWTDKVSVEDAQSQITSAIEEVNLYTDTKINELKDTTDSVKDDVQNLSTTLYTHISNTNIHTSLAEKEKWNSKADGDHTHIMDGRIKIDASDVVSGIFPISMIPKGAIENTKTVTNDTERFALTTDDVQNGDMVYVEDTESFYFVVNDTKLNADEGYKIYSTGIAKSMEWANILNKPTSVSGYGITDTYTKSEVDEVVDNSQDALLLYTDNKLKELNDLHLVMPIDNSNVSGNTLNSTIYVNNKYIAVGYNGVIILSTDGITWNKSIVTNILYSVIYGNGKYIAVGYNGAIFSSSDGVLWTKENNSISTNILYSVTYDNGKFIAVGANGIILSSIDGTLWVKVESGVSNHLYSIIYANNKYLIVGTNGIILSSTDGFTWSKVESDTDRALTFITYINNKFIVIGSNGTILSSTDGVIWAKETSGTTETLRGIAYGNGKYIAVGDNGTILSSVDGVSWIKVITNVTNILYSVTYGNGKFIVVGENGITLIIILSTINNAITDIYKLGLDLDETISEMYVYENIDNKIFPQVITEINNNLDYSATTITNLTSDVTELEADIDTLYTTSLNIIELLG